MIWLVLSSILLVVSAVLFHQQKESTSKASAVAYPYALRHHILSPPEKTFYTILLRALADHALVFPKVQADRILTPREGLVSRDMRVMQQKLAGRFFDFVICHRSDLQVLGVVEMSDRSARLHRPGEDEMFVVKACRGAGLKLFQFDARRTYDLQQVRDVFHYPARTDGIVQNRRAQQRSSSVPGSVPSESGQALADVRKQADKVKQTTSFDARKVTQRSDADTSLSSQTPASPETGTTTQPPCPRCHSALHKKAAKYGKDKGSTFVLCSRFPTCDFQFKLD